MFGAGASCANDINHPAQPRARLSPRQQRRYRCGKSIVAYEILRFLSTKLFDLTIIEALPCDHLAIASTHDPSSRYHRAKEKNARRFNGIVDSFRTAGIGSALDPADRTCARSRRSPLASRLRTIEIAR